MTHTLRLMLPLVLAVAVCEVGETGESSTNVWTNIASRAGRTPMLVWAPKLKRFIFYSPGASLGDGGKPGYDFQSLDPATGKWSNELPEAAKGRLGPDGAVKAVRHKSPYFAMKDTEGLIRPNTRQMFLWYHFAFAPWDECIYLLVCGRTLRYDIKARSWNDMNPPTAPSGKSKTPRGGLSWSAMCADPANREILLFGGSGLTTADSSPGTWVYSPEKNAWRKLEPKTPPPPRALSPMVYDPATEKILLFGGDRLDMVYADTWVYDVKTREWEERKPDVSPSPRFGHALLRLPKSGKIVLFGGKTCSSKGGAYGGNHKDVPFEVWTYDVGKNTWGLIDRPEGKGTTPRPTSFHRGSNLAAIAAASADDTVLFAGAAPKRGEHVLWSCRLDASDINADATAKYGAKPGKVDYRTGPYDPEWYGKDVPAPDPTATKAFFKSMPANQFVVVDPPKYPQNRRGGGWSTTTFDTDRDQILNISGGHVAYFGSDVAHYDVKTNRWSISYRGQFPLEYVNYGGGLDGPGSWGFNGAPWGNHNYHAYTYDPTLKRMVYVKDGWTVFYDPEKKSWPHEEKFRGVPGNGSKYTTYLLSTPKGVVAWSNPKAGLHRLEGGKKWVPLEKSGKIPGVLCDGSAAVYDSKRDRLLMVSTHRGKDRKAPMVQGQVWSYDFKSGEAKALDPINKDAVFCGRFAREAVYLPKDDLMFVGYRLKIGEKVVVPLYDCAKNRWLGAEIKGSEIIGKTGCQVCLGLTYDPKRNLVWAVNCVLSRKKGTLKALRIDMETLGAKPLKK